MKVLLLILLSSNVLALSINDLEINGFMTIGAQKANLSETDGNGQEITYNGSTSYVSYDDGTKAGISASTMLSNDYRGKIQLISTQTYSGYKSALDIAQLSFDYSSNVYVRVGRFRLPTWLASEYLQIGVLYPWQRPPIEVYGKNPINSLNGGMITFHKNTLAGYNLSFDMFLGGEQTTISGGYKTDIEMNSKNTYGVNLLISNNIITLKLANLRAEIFADIYNTAFCTACSSTGGPVIGKSQIPFNLGNINLVSAGLKIDTGKILVMSEYVKMETQNTYYELASSAYVTFGYNFEKLNLLTYVTLAKDIDRDADLYPDLEQSLSIGANLRLNNNAVWKIEIGQIDYIQGDTSPLPGVYRAMNLTGDPLKKVTLLSGSFNMVF